MEFNLVVENERTGILSYWQKILDMSYSEWGGDGIFQGYFALYETEC